MSPKATIGINIDKLHKELEEIKSGKQNQSKDARLNEIAKNFAHAHDYASSLEACELVSNETARNLLIADIIEESILPSKELSWAKKFAKYITPSPEILPLVQIRIALAANDREQTKQIIESLPTPLSRNFAFMQVIESYFLSRNKETTKARELGELMLENTKSVKDPKARSYLLREIAVNLYLANNEKNLAKEAANLIPDKEVREQTLRKIG